MLCLLALACVVLPLQIDVSTDGARLIATHAHAQNFEGNASQDAQKPSLRTVIKTRARRVRAALTRLLPGRYRRFAFTSRTRLPLVRTAGNYAWTTGAVGGASPKPPEFWGADRSASSKSRRSPAGFGSENAVSDPCGCTNTRQSGAQLASYYQTLRGEAIDASRRTITASPPAARVVAPRVSVPRTQPTTTSKPRRTRSASRDTRTTPRQSSRSSSARKSSRKKVTRKASKSSSKKRRYVRKTRAKKRRRRTTSRSRRRQRTNWRDSIWKDNDRKH